MLLNNSEVSVYTTIKNVASIKINCVDSILSQTYRDFEWIVVCDCDKDRDDFAALCADDPRVKILRNPSEGRWHALRFAIEQCKNEFVFNQDFDDIPDKDRLRKQLTMLGENPNLAAVGGWYVAEYRDDMIREEHKDCGEINYIRRVLPLWLPFAHSFCAFRRSAVLSVGGYPVDRLLEDGIIWARLIAAGFDVGIVQEIIGTHFIYSNSTFGKCKKYFSRELAVTRDRIEMRRTLGLAGYLDVIITLRLIYRLLPNRLQSLIRSTVFHGKLMKQKYKSDQK